VTRDVSEGTQELNRHVPKVPAMQVVEKANMEFGRGWIGFGSATVAPYSVTKWTMRQEHLSRYKGVISEYCQS
jgi:hypothetical protein